MLNQINRIIEAATADFKVIAVGDEPPLLIILVPALPINEFSP
jgi:hypothetical protein